MTDWITRLRAAEILGVSTNTVDRLVTFGELTPRPDLTWRGGKPSLDPAEVVRVAEQRAAEQAEAEQRHLERKARRIVAPDDEHDWLTASQAARVVGLSEMGLRKRVWREAVPVTTHGGRLWFRRDLMELIAHAAAARHVDGVVDTIGRSLDARPVGIATTHSAPPAPSTWRHRS